MTLPRIDSTPQQQPKNQQRQLKPQQKDEHSAEPVRGYQDSLAAFVRIDVRLPQKHRVILRDKLRALQDSGAKLSDGTEVTDKTKAFLWILENLVDRA